MDVYDKKAMVPNPIPCGHGAGIGDSNIRGSPYPIDWKLTPKEGQADLLAGVGSHHLLHPSSSFFVKCLPHHLFVDVLICVEAYHNAISCSMPCCQELDQIFMELSARACPVVLRMHDEEVSLLLIASATI